MTGERYDMDSGEANAQAEIGGLLIAEFFNDVRIIASFFMGKK